MYTYLETEKGLWQVGYFDDVGNWISDYDYDMEKHAIRRVHFLNREKTDLNLRDYFAVAALQGMISNHDYIDISSESMAKIAYMCADAMMKQRDKL